MPSFVEAFSHRLEQVETTVAQVLAKRHGSNTSHIDSPYSWPSPPKPEQSSKSIGFISSPGPYSDYTPDNGASPPMLPDHGDANTTFDQTLFAGRHLAQRNSGNNQPPSSDEDLERIFPRTEENISFEIPDCFILNQVLATVTLRLATMPLSL
ncbi:hypothetical protein FALBO_15800 [Fusarium albosuccineum]|uniref:Uncharacterized protein n=1 Tax=Fusarium albosuccineum TaxID=1237068 RepID=A0A8H4KNK9_9HYPO|nr:hypothetical protein FALBO_15800 [Fusarium albosuccineum]